MCEISCYYKNVITLQERGKARQYAGPFFIGVSLNEKETLSRLALVQRLYRSLLHAVVNTQRTHQLVIGELLDDMRGPAGDAAHDEDGGEDGDFEAHQVIGGPNGIIEIRMDIHYLLLLVFQKFLLSQQFLHSAFLSVPCYLLSE